VLWSTSQRLADEAAHRRAAEAALQRASGDLERAAERTADLYRSNDELEQFAYIASHDLQAPLRGIAHLVTWLEEDLGPALAGDTRHKMDLLRQRVRRLETMLSDLLQYSRAGRSVPSELIEPARLIADVIESIDPPAGFELEVDVPEGALRTAAAPLQQVVLNLIDNAVKHHDRTAGHIVVSARDRGERLEFAVTDDGPGIPAQQRERVFQMFYALQPRDKVEGNGIGLAVVQKAVATRGGKVAIEDNPEGRGMTIRFDWPKAVQESDGA
jgi:signal transduction histidine kinase